MFTIKLLQYQKNFSLMMLSLVSCPCLHDPQQLLQGHNTFNSNDSCPFFHFKVGVFFSQMLDKIWFIY